MAEEAEEKSNILSCREAIQIMCKQSKRNVDFALSKIEPETLECNYIQLIPGAMRIVAEATGAKMVTLVACGKTTYDILFDGSKIPKLSHLKSPVRYWYFTRRGVLKGIYLKPQWTSIDKHFPPTVPQTSSLSDALKLYPEIECKLLPEFPNCKPKDHKELEKVFRASKIDNVFVHYVISWKPPLTYIPWFKFVRGHRNFLVVHAYKNALGEIQYAMLKDPSGQRPSLLRERPDGSQSGPSNPMLKTISEHYMTSQNNRRSSMSLMENGLNLALRLGVISHDEFVHHAYLQAAFNGFLFCKFLNCYTIIAMGYVDFEDSRTVFIRRDRDWIDFFIYLRERVARLAEMKKETLAPILERLRRDGLNPIGSKHKQCYEELVYFSKKAKVFTYDSDDRILHLLKIPLANYLYEVEGKKFTSVTMKMARNNSLCELIYKNMSIVNLGSILGLEEHTNVDGDLAGLRKGMAQWDPYFSASGDSSPDEEYDFGEYPVEHCICYAKNLFNCYQNFSHHFIATFRLDINTCKFLCLPNLSYILFWHAYLKLSPNGFLVHPVEKSLPANDALLRKHCHGGYTFSAHTEIWAGKPLEGVDRDTGTTGGDFAKSIYSLDLTASYGFAASRAASPGGFGSTWKFGKRQENSQRYRFFEFRAVFYTIYKWQQQQDLKLVAAYHNYSPLGLYWVGKYPVDLVGIFEDGSMEMYQMDGAYCHGCPNPNCADLASYVEGRSRQECQEKTLQRNQEIWDWIGDRHDRIKFCTVSDCCNQEYSNAALKIYFQTIPELAQLVTGYDKIDGKLDNLDKELTFVAVADISCSPLDLLDRQQKEEALKDFEGPLFLDSKKMGWSGKVLLTRDYYRYLKTNFSVCVRHLELVVFYRVDRVIPLVYRYFLQQRTSYSDAINKFYKSVINMSCGFFGSDPSKKIIRSTRLTHKAPRKFSFLTHKIVALPDTEYPADDPTYVHSPEMTYHTNKHVLIVVQTYVPQAARENPKPSLQSLPLFATIIEFGKLRLNQIFYFYSLQIPRHLYKVVYAHVDSTIVAVARETLEEAARNPEEFKVTWLQKYFSAEKKPGFLHCEFHHDSSTNWKFVTPTVCMWSLMKDNDNNQIYKMPGVPKKSNALMYEKHCQYLREGIMTVPTQRRVNKIAGPRTSNLDLHYVDKKIN